MASILCLGLLGLSLASADRNACGKPEFRKFPYCDHKLSTKARVEDFVGRMTLAEKIQILGNGQQQGVPRLGMDMIYYGEGLHGVFCGCATNPSDGSSGCATAFPNPTSLGASFNRTLWYKIGRVIGTGDSSFCTLG